MSIGNEKKISQMNYRNCLSTDTRPEVANGGDLLYELDTAHLYEFGNNSWFLKSPTVNEMILKTGVATNGSNTTLIDTTKSFIIDEYANKKLQVFIDGVEYVRKIIGNTTDTITIDRLLGSVATAILGEGENVLINIEAKEEGVFANEYLLNVIKGVENGDLNSIFESGVLTVILGMGLGDSATTTIGTVESDIIEIEVVEKGGVGNNYTIEVDANTNTIERTLGATLTDDNILISLATVPLDKASVNIGSGENGVLNIESIVAGVDANDYNVTVVQGDSDLVVTFNEDSMLITLASEGSTVEVVSAYINTNFIELFTSTPSGTGKDLLQVQDVTYLTGGSNKLDNVRNTSLLITTEINTMIPEVVATVIGDGTGIFTEPEAQKHFTGGGENPVVDNLKNTALLVADSINLLDNFASVATGSGVGIIEETVESIKFSGGVDTILIKEGARYFIQDNDGVVDFIFHEASTELGVGTACVVRGKESATISITGDTTTQNILFYGTTFDDIIIPIVGIKLGDILEPKAVSTNSKDEAWFFKNIEGLKNIYFEIDDIVGGALTITGRII